MNALLQSSSAELRVGAALRWLGERSRGAPVLVVGATQEAAAEAVRTVVGGGGAAFGWRATTLGRLAGVLAERRLAAARRAPVGALSLEAVCARVIAKEGAAGRLGRYAEIADRPGLPRALARTFLELRLNAIEKSGTDLDPLLEAYARELEQAGFADRAVLLREANAVAREESHPLTGARHPLVGAQLLLLDVPVLHVLERELIASLVESAPAALATCPAGDTRSLAALATALRAAPETLDDASSSPLRQLQRNLFRESTAGSGALGDDVVLFSAPGENRECVEIARRILAEAAGGTPFDSMAVLLRAPSSYRPHLEEALARAGIPAHFSAGTRRGDPAGRAFLALLECAAEGLSARRFAEYLSLGEVPQPTELGQPPAPPPAAFRWSPPDEEAFPRVELEPGADPAADEAPHEPGASRAEPGASGTEAVVVGTLRAPRHWEKLLVEAAVIGGLDRWRRRLDGLEEKLRRDLAEIAKDSEARAQAIQRDIAGLVHLSDFALPLLEDLGTLRKPATWASWLDRLSALAARALRRPDRVLAVLAELGPLGPLGPVSLGEVRIVLAKKLADLPLAREGPRYGRVLVAPVDAARGRTFDVVFAPGLAEKVFPQKVAEDPLLLDAAREGLPAELARNAERVEQERLALRLASGAAGKRLYLSYPRVEVELGRPRVPSFYGLEAVRAVEGVLPDFASLAIKAEQVSGVRLGWPAPRRPEDAIDDAEYDLATLEELLRLPPESARGRARFLIEANGYLGRALRTRARRWRSFWSAADGLVLGADSVAAAALAKHSIHARPYSPTGLQNFAACPYRFALAQVFSLSPREEPEAIEEMDPLQKGSLVHDVLFHVLTRLKEEGLLPLTPASRPSARAHLDAVVTEVAARHREELAPAIERVWEDGIAQIRADLSEWLRREVEDGEGWTPERFELSFGLEQRERRDPASASAPVALDCGLRLRGAIDLVELGSAGGRRVTDFKTGKDRTETEMVIGGGELLQPVLYALVLEKLLPERPVESGRLYFCTSDGGYAARAVPLGRAARAAAATLADVVEDSLKAGFLPAAPREGACEWCDFRPICGPNEERRSARKKKDRLGPIARLRATP